MLKNIHTSAILAFLISMCSINPATADGHVVEFCMTPYKDNTHDECLTAINKGARLYQNCSRKNGCDKGRMEPSLGQGALSLSIAHATATKTDNSIRFLYNGKWFNIRDDWDKNRNRFVIQCYAFYMKKCTD
jgi:hypothetical protein